MNTASTAAEFFCRINVYPRDPQKNLSIVDTAKIGKKGGEARAANLTAGELSESGRKAAQARWELYYREHPEKLKEKLAREAKKRGRGRKRAAPVVQAKRGISGMKSVADR